MEECRNNSSFSRDGWRKKQNPRTPRRSASLLVVPCCLAAVMLAIGLFANGFLVAADKQPNAHLSACLQNSEKAAWYLILVNKWNYIPDDYEVELTELSNGQLVDTRIFTALQDMLDAARSDGVYPVVVSGYRTAEKQQSLMDDKIDEYRDEGYSATEAITKAEAWVAVSGTSEHQLGIAVDINADGINSAGHEVYNWLEKNAHKYGFICRYPTDKTEITGVIGEPWHYRYVGTRAAAEICSQGVCFEEYLNNTK